MEDIQPGAHAQRHVEAVHKPVLVQILRQQAEEQIVQGLERQHNLVTLKPVQLMVDIQLGAHAQRHVEGVHKPAHAQTRHQLTAEQIVR